MTAQIKDRFETACKTGDLKSCLLSPITLIARAICNTRSLHVSRDLSLVSGLAGEMLFYTHLWQVTRANRFRSIAHAYLSRIEELFGETNWRDISLFGGATGVVWALRHTARVLDEDLTHSLDVYKDVYDVIIELLRQVPTTKTQYDFDLINGIVGVGMWGLSIPEKEWRDQVVGYCVQALADVSETVDGGIAWKTPVSRRAFGNVPRGFNLGVAHGVPGIIGFLTHCIILGVSTGTSLELMKQSVSWMSSVALEKKSISVFGYESGHHTPARLAWCYGDAGVAIVLEAANRILRSSDTRLLIERVVESASRRRAEDALVYDAGFCHGTAGLLHIFSELSRRLNTPTLNDAKSYWLGRLLSERNDQRGIAGFPCWSSIRRRFEFDSGLLSGATGVGLVLLSQIQPDLGWDWPFLTASSPLVIA